MSDSRDDNSTILVVDDTQDTRTLMKELLEEHSYRVVAATDEMDAVESMRQERPDIIVMNQHMPPLDAIEAGCRIREGMEQGQDVPVVVIPTESTKVKGINVPLGRNVYVTFWSAFRQLENLLRRLLHPRDKSGGRYGEYQKSNTN